MSDSDVRLLFGRGVSISLEEAVESEMFRPRGEDQGIISGEQTFLCSPLLLQSPARLVPLVFIVWRAGGASEITSSN